MTGIVTSVGNLRLMTGISFKSFSNVLAITSGLLIIKVTVEVVLGYSNYFPPNFESEFLYGRQYYFFGTYRWAFYPHIVSGPLALLLGLVLISENFRLRFPKWHRNLGRIHVVNVLGIVAPSGLWMARDTSTGNDRGYQLCNPVCVDRRVRRPRLASGGQATVSSSSPLDVAQLSAAHLSRGAQAIRRIGNRDAGAIGVV